MDVQGKCAPYVTSTHTVAWDAAPTFGVARGARTQSCGDARNSACSPEGTQPVSAVADVGRNLVAVPPGGEVAEGRIFARSFVKSIRSFISRGRDCMCAVLDQRLNPKRRGHRLPCDAPILFFPVSNYSVEPEDVPRVRDTGSRSGVAVVG